MDIEKLRKEMTREEFLKYERENNEQCPSDFGLKDIYCSEKDCIFNFECEKCWEKSVENIKFKDDMEDKKLNKELNILQAIEMPIGTEFKVIDNADNVMILSIYEVGEAIAKDECYLSDKVLCWSKTGEIIQMGDYEIGLKLIPIEKPVSFMEAVKKAKTNRFRIEHELLESQAKLGHTLLGTLRILVSRLNLSNNEIADIMLNGKCYIEENEDLNND